MIKRKIEAYRMIRIIVRILFAIEFFVPVVIWLFNREGVKFINMFTAALGFSLTFIPEALDKLTNHKLKLSSKLSGVIVLFIFAAEFLGEIKEFYYLVPWWDVMLHSMSGVILGMIGFMLVYMLNASESARVELSPFFICFFAFCFALAAGAVWEIFEFSGDRIFGMNMQKYMPPSGTTELITADWRYDAGLIDTMKDIICDAVSALATSVVGYISLMMHRRDRNSQGEKGAV